LQELTKPSILTIAAPTREGRAAVGCGRQRYHRAEVIGFITVAGAGNTGPADRSAAGSGQGDVEVVLDSPLFGRLAYQQ